MKRHRNIVLCRERGDSLDLANTAGAGDIRLDEIDRASNDEVFERIVGMQIFADGNRHFGFLTKRGVSFDILDKQRLFEPERAALSKRGGSLEADIDRISLV